jgi:hypothetical protein
MAMYTPINITQALANQVNQTNQVMAALAQIDQRLNAMHQRFDTVEHHLEITLAISRNNRILSRNRVNITSQCYSPLQKTVSSRLSLSK